MLTARRKRPGDLTQAVAGSTLRASWSVDLRRGNEMRRQSSQTRGRYRVLLSPAARPGGQQDG
jgi:hypothetical protein